jgi:hypothetical protein
MDSSFHWVFARGSQWYVFPESVQEEIERLWKKDIPGKFRLSAFPAPVHIDNCFSYIVYFDRNGTPSGYAIARVLANAQLNE